LRAACRQWVAIVGVEKTTPVFPGTAENASSHSKKVVFFVKIKVTEVASNYSVFFSCGYNVVFRKQQPGVK
jgi:hypothetical protein